MQPYDAQWLSIVPPIVAIGLALITKEVFSSLFIGILTGTLIYACGTGANIVMGTLETAFKLMGAKLDFDIIIFCSLLGALVYILNMSGGTMAYGRVAARAIRPLGGNPHQNARRRAVCNVHPRRSHFHRRLFQLSDSRHGDAPDDGFI